MNFKVKILIDVVSGKNLRRRVAEVRGSGLECQAATAQERLRGATLHPRLGCRPRGAISRPRPGVAAGRSHPRPRPGPAARRSNPRSGACTGTRGPRGAIPR